MSQNHQIAVEWSKKAFECRKQGNFKDALRCIEEALKLEPKSEIFILDKANILEQAERYQEALQIYKEYAKNVPESWNGFMGAAQILRKLGRFEEAKPFEEEVNVRLNPDTNPYAFIIDPKIGLLGSYIRKINALLKVGRKTDATLYCYDYIKKIGDNYWIYTILANIFLGENSKNVALDYCEKALRNKPDFYGALLVKGNVLIQKKEPNNAIMCLNTLLKQKDVPNYERAEAYSAMGAAYMGLRENNKALENINEALRLNPNIDTAWFMKGNILLIYGQVAEGMKALQKALEINKNQGPVIEQLLRELKLKK